MRTQGALLIAACFGLSGCTDYASTVDLYQASSPAFGRALPVVSQQVHDGTNLLQYAGTTDYSAVLSDYQVRKALAQAMGPASSMLVENLSVPTAPVELRTSNGEQYLLLKGRQTQGSVNEAAVLAIRPNLGYVKIDAATRHAGHADEWITWEDSVNDDEIDVFLEHSLERHLRNGDTESKFSLHRNGNAETLEIESK